MKVKVLVEHIIDLPITKLEATRVYRDCLWPVEALALDKITEAGIRNLIDGSEAEVRDVFVYD